jgi:DNA-binding PadR family transcriptional regulator
VIGPLAMCVGTYLPFQTTYNLNGHNFIEIELLQQGVAFRKEDNAFLSTSDPQALQAAADKLSASIIEKRLNYWTWLLGPKLSQKDRQAVHVKREYSINQIEYCRNFIFKRHFPLHKIFEQSCEMGLFRLAADKVAYIFGVRVTKWLNGKLHSVLEKLDHDHHVLRIYCKKLVGRMYEKFSTFLRVEVCVNRMKDLGLNKGLENLGRLRQKLVAITDRFAGFEAQSLNVHVDFPLFQRMALPVMAGKTKIAGIKIHDTRMMRLMEVLLHGGTQLDGWRSADIHQAILTTFGLSAATYTLTQLRYDLRKMKAHGLLERIGHGYRYRLTDKGVKAALMFILFHKRVCGPLANSLFHHRPDENLKPASKVETAYHKADHAIQKVIDLLAA